MNFSNNQKANRFEWRTDEGTSYIDYQQTAGSEKITLVHTEVPRHLQGRGIAGTLVRHTLDYVRQEGWKVIPRCSYIKNFIQHHEEYQDLVAEMEE